MALVDSNVARAQDVEFIEHDINPVKKKRPMREQQLGRRKTRTSDTGGIEIISSLNKKRSLFVR